MKDEVKSVPARGSREPEPVELRARPVQSAAPKQESTSRGHAGPDATPEKAARNATIDLRFVGDVIFGRYSTRAFRAIVQPGESPFVSVAPLLESDFTVANLETPVVDPLPAQKPIEGDYVFGATPADVSLLREAGVDAVTVANNHAFDQGEAGMQQTPRWLREQDLEVFGAPRSTGHEPRVERVTVGGWSVVVVAVTARLNYAQDTQTLQVPFLTTRALGERVPEMLRAEPADLRIVMVHWGQEYADAPDEAQRTVAHAVIDAGADLVIGHHPHVLQEIELYRGGVIAYSLGNFLFENTNPVPRLTGVLGVRALASRCITEVSFSPVVMAAAPRPHPVPAVGGDAEAARRRVIARGQSTAWQRDEEALVWRAEACTE